MKRHVRMVYLIAILIFEISSTNIEAQARVKRTYYSENKIKSITYFNKERTTKVIMFYLTGKPKSEANFDSSGQLFGKQALYYESGMKKSESFILGIESIPYKLYSDSETSDDKFIDVITSRVTFFFENGVIKSKGYIVNGMRSGYWIFYNKDGTIEKTQFYKCLTKDE